MEIIPELTALAAKIPRIAIKVEGRIIFIDPNEVISVEAQGNYVLLVRSSGSYLLRACISALAEKLQPYSFIQVHRAVLVNTSWVQEIKPTATGEYRLRTKNGKEYTVSRTYKKNLRSIAQFWIGNDALFTE